MKKVILVNSEDDFEENTEDEKSKLVKIQNLLDSKNYLYNPDKFYLEKAEKEDLIYGFTKLLNQKLRNTNEIDFNKWKIKIKNIKLDNLNVDVCFDSAFYLALKLLPKLEREFIFYFYIENMTISKISKKLNLSIQNILVLKEQAELHLKNNFYMILKLLKIKKMESKGGDFNE